MSKAKKLRICNWTLLIFSIFTLASSIQLEATGSNGFVPVWIHVITAIIFSLLVFYHIFLHFKWSNWFSMFPKLKSPVTKILWWLYLMTTVLGIISLFQWVIHSTHSHIGGIHGKFGFVMLAVALGHTLKRIKFFQTRKK